MADARAIVAEIRGQLAVVERRLMQHPYLAAVEAGQIDRARLNRFAAQQRYIIPSDLRSIALLLNRYGAGPSGPFFVAALETERAALAALQRFERALGSDGVVDATTVLPGAVAYSHFLAWLALYGSDAEFAAAFLVNLQAWGRNCGRLARALRIVYGFTDADVAFFDLFANEAPDFEAAALEVIAGGLDHGVRPASLLLAARLLQGYEVLYWDALDEVSHD